MQFDDRMMIETVMQDLEEIDGILIGTSSEQDFKTCFSNLEKGKEDLKEILEGEMPVPELRPYLELRLRNFDDLSFALGLIMQGQEMMKLAVSKFKKSAEEIIEAVEARCGEKYIPEKEKKRPPFESTGSEVIDPALMALYQALVAPFEEGAQEEADEQENEKGEDEDA